jgi:hypothetical protein
MENIQQQIIARLNESQTYESDEEGYQRYMRRELFEGFLYSEYGLDFCGCGNQEASLQEVVKALEFASVTSNKDRSQVLMQAFGVKKVSDNALVQVLFYLLTAKGFIYHDDYAEINDSELTQAGEVFLPMLRQYLGQ